MKRICLFLAVLMTLAVFVGCSDKKKVSTQHQKEYTFSKQDSMEVLNLLDGFIACLDSNNIKGAVEMLNILKGDSIFPLQPDQQHRQAIALKMVQGVKYHVSYVIFKSDKDNEARMDITLFEKEENDPKPNKTAFYFRPVRFEGKWYLTAKDVTTDRMYGNTLKEEQETVEETVEE